MKRAEELEGLWRTRTDEELKEAADNFWQYTETALAAIQKVMAERGLDTNQIDAQLANTSGRTPLVVVDVSKRASAIRWIRFGSRLHIAFCVFLAAQALVASQAGLAFSLAALSLMIVPGLISFGLARHSICAGVASVAFFGLPLTTLGIFAAVDGGPGAAAAVALYLPAGLLTLPPFFSLLRYRRLSGRLGVHPGVPANPFQLKFFQSWRDYRQIILSLVLIPTVTIIGFIIVFMGSAILKELFGVSGWWVDFLLTTIGGPLMVSGPVFFLRARRLAAVSATEIRKRQPGAPILHLRSFHDDHLGYHVALRGPCRLKRRWSEHFPVMDLS